MTDKELLTLAAKAVGEWPSPEPFEHVMDRWNPLTDNGDAFRLAVKLDIDVLFMSDDEGRFTSAEGRYYAYAQHNGDPLAATRLAIVRAAAAIGQEMP